MRAILKSEEMKNILLTLLCAAGYIAAVLLLQAIAPGHSGFGVEKKLLVYSAVLFAVPVWLHRFSKKYIFCFVAFLFLYLSVVVLEILTGMAVRGSEIKRTVYFATLIFVFLSAISDFASLWDNQPVRRVFRAVFSVFFLLGILYPLVFWGYYAASGQFVSVDIMLAVFQTNISEALSYVRMQAHVFPLFLVFGCLSIGYISYKCVIPPPE